MSSVRDASSYVDLFWLPLGAGGHVVRWNGRVFEALVAARERRPRQDIYHAALAVTLDGARFTIEMAPAWGVPDHGDRGVVRQGPVGARWLGRSRFFCYEVRRWRGGVIPDVDFAVDSPQRVSTEADRAGEVLRLAPLVPAVTWGRDELGAGEMWNSNSLVAWLLVLSDHDMQAIRPPSGGRAPGWSAGVAVAGRGEPASS